MIPNCNICKHENSEICLDCYPSGTWGTCYFQRDKNKEENFNFHTPKDKLYEFVDIHSTGKPVEIRSKGQWQKHLKKHGLHDDVPQRSITEKDFKSSVKEDVNSKREIYKSMIREEMKQKNIYDAKKLFKK